MGAKYTEAQKRAISKYQKKFVRTALPLTGDQHERFYALAEEKGLSLTKLVISLLEREYKMTHESTGEVTIKTELPTKITLTEEQEAALAYVRKLYREFVSYPDFLWDWNWQSEGILNSFDSPSKTGAINRRLQKTGFSPIQGIVVDQDSIPKNNRNFSPAETQKQYDDYIDVMLGLKKAIISYFNKIDELCGTEYANEM